MGRGEHFAFTGRLNENPQMKTTCTHVGLTLFNPWGLHCSRADFKEL